MKLKISPYRILITFFATTLIAGALLFAITFNIFLKWPWDWRAPTLLGLWIASSIFFLVISLVSNYYVLNKKYVTVHRFRKEMVYNFSEIIYINEELSEKKKMIYFFTKQGHVRYLTFDRKNILYPTMLEKCNNRMDKEEFEFRYPNVKW